MEIIIREYQEKDLSAMIEIWNEVVEEGVAFPQMEPLREDGEAFFSGQDYTAVAEADGEIAGLYIIHPNNIGRCGHLSNSSYAVKSTARGKGLGKQLVLDSLEKARELGYRIHQFNAVVKSNPSAHYLYEKLGFIKTGEVPGGFLMKDGHYEDIVLYHYILTEDKE